MSKKNARPLDEKQRRRIETAPPKWREGLRKAIQGTVPPRYAIKMQCLECNGFSVADITTCTATACPLYQYRLGHNPVLDRSGG